VQFTFLSPKETIYKDAELGKIRLGMYSTHTVTVHWKGFLLAPPGLPGHILKNHPHTTLLT
jgi:hypothetical protein